MKNELVTRDSTLVAKAWDNYINSSILVPDTVNPTVLNSWDRCRLLGVNPFVNNFNGVFGSELEERLKRRENLIKIARPFMNNLYNFVKGSGFQVILSDENGILLEVLGDPEVLEQTKKVALYPGGDWSEASKGTNAIGTAIAEKAPVQIFAFEHFCQYNHFLTCSAAPIFDQEGQLIGILDVSGDYRKANPHTLGMVVAAVYAIESQLRLQKATNKLYMAYKYSNTIIDSISEGLISIDSQGILTHINAIGAKILGIDPVNYHGKSIEEILEQKLPILDTLRTGQGYSDKELFIVNKHGRKHITSTVTPLKDEQGNVIGATAIVREMQAIQKLVSKMSGSQARFTFNDIIGYSNSMAEVLYTAKLAADSISTVLLSGESGTGKELFAQAIHNASSRHSNPFIAINCGALPRDLIESELFGYEEGAFTGAQKGGRPGKFELANGGSIFLDEIGDMPLETQVKLLRVLQEKQVTRVGGHKVIPVDIRVITATHRNLVELVEQGNFRPDLFYRLNVINLNIPPLRQRGDDVVLLSKHLIDKLAVRLNKVIREIPSEFLEFIKDYSWPGNVRELENALERVINLTTDGILKIEDLPIHIKNSRQVENKAGSLMETTNSNNKVIPLWEAEKSAIKNALDHFEGNISKVAEALGIGRNTLYRKIKEYNIGL